MSEVHLLKVNLPISVTEVGIEREVMEDSAKVKLSNAVSEVGIEIVDTDLHCLKAPYLSVVTVVGMATILLLLQEAQSEQEK